MEKIEKSPVLRYSKMTAANKNRMTTYAQRSHFNNISRQWREVDNVDIIFRQYFDINIVDKCQTWGF